MCTYSNHYEWHISLNIEYRYHIEMVSETPASMRKVCGSMPMVYGSGTLLEFDMTPRHEHFQSELMFKTQITLAPC